MNLYFGLLSAPIPMIYLGSFPVWLCVCPESVPGMEAGNPGTHIKHFEQNTHQSALGCLLIWVDWVKDSWEENKYDNDITNLIINFSSIRT